MSIHISGKHVEIGDALQTFIREQFSHLIDHIGDTSLGGDVVLTKEHHVFRVDLSLHVGRNFVVHIHAEDADPYKSVTLSFEKMEQRIRKYKARLKDRKRRQSSDQTLPALQYVLNTEGDDPLLDVPVVVAEMNADILTLTVSEAVMRMDLLEAPALLFRHAGNDRLNLVYRRLDGHIGWVDPGKQ